MTADKFVTTAPASSAKLDLYLDRLAAAHSPTTRGRLIFALDATGSRQHCWDLATSLTAKCLKAVSGLPLDIQLVYYRGISECKALPWMSDTHTLTNKMKGVQCDSGETQINRILAHAQKEDFKQKVQALVFIGDACEENPDTLAITARKLGVPAFMFQEGDDEEVAGVFKNIAKLTHGAYCKFDKGSAKQLAELLGAVAAFATGGQAALMSTKAGVLLLKQLKS
jgi:hypothetical protein